VWCCVDVAAAGFPYRFESHLDLIKPVALCLDFNPSNDNKTQPPPYLGRVAGSAYTVNLYPNPTTPLTSLYPKSHLRLRELHAHAGLLALTRMHVLRQRLQLVFHLHRLQ
jgi:hypothetical protein